MKPPKELIDVVRDAMFEYGPDGHCDGAEEIAQATLDWFNETQRQWLPSVVTHT